MTGCVRDFLIQYGMLEPSFDIIAAAERMRREMPANGRAIDMSEVL